MCSEAMTLRGNDPGYFQGCDGHVFWVDADTIAHTGLANGVDEAKLQRKRESSAVLEQEQQARVAHETERMNAKREKEEREARLQPDRSRDPVRDLALRLRQRDQRLDGVVAVLRDPAEHPRRVGGDDAADGAGDAARRVGNRARGSA